MTPVDQEFINDPENSQIGDCFRACIASVLEVPIAAVPHFALLGNRWSRVADFYCESLGRELLWADGVPPDNLNAIVTVQSPRNSDIKHSVIYFNGVMVHDPHPDKTGGKPTGGYFYLIPDLPSTHVRK